MRIQTLEFEDKVRGWKLSETHFDQLTLLVGASGVGKTQILRAIDTLREISKGESFGGVSWKVRIIATDGESYCWEGEFEARPNKDSGNGFDHSSKILFELINKNGVELVKREGEKVLFNGNQTIKLSRERSIVNLIEEEFAQNIRKSFSMITFHDYSRREEIGHGIYPEFGHFEPGENLTLEELTLAPITSMQRLIFAFHARLPVFQQVKERFTEIFPTIQDMRFAPENEAFSDVEFVPFEYHLLYIKESGVDQWIEEDNISSGMMRTLAHLSEIYLSAPGSVFLIDEFENSLGINCINELTADMLQADRSLQFIITSHHPYIINAIGFSHWKIVTRTGGVVKTHDAADLNLGRSKHEAFMQLLQRPEYQTGTESQRV